MTTVGVGSAADATTCRYARYALEQKRAQVDDNNGGDDDDGSGGGNGDATRSAQIGQGEPLHDTTTADTDASDDGQRAEFGMEGAPRGEPGAPGAPGGLSSIEEGSEDPSAGGSGDGDGKKSSITSRRRSTINPSVVKALMISTTQAGKARGDGSSSDSSSTNNTNSALGADGDGGIDNDEEHAFSFGGGGCLLYTSPSPRDRG